MKSWFKKQVFQLLKALVRRHFQQLHPQIVGVTGSAGKTTSKEAIAAVLDRRFKIKKSEASLNSEYGVALSVLNLPSGYSSPWKWAKILSKGFLVSLKKPESYEYLVQEMGVDKPGDMDSILDLIRPDVMVFLNVKNVHRGKGQFENREAILKEKAKACFAVKENGWVVLNGDDLFVQQIAKDLKANVLTFGEGERCDLRASKVKSSRHGLSFTLHYDNETVEMDLPHILGVCHLEAALAATAVGFLAGLPITVIQTALKEFHLPAGRMNLIEGLHGSTIIDSSYNASPDTMEAGLQVLSLFPGHRIAALGSMNELGDLADSAHIKLGALAAEHAHELIAVGAHAKDIAEGARQGGMYSSKIHVFANSKEAGEFLKEGLNSSSVVLAKGSQNGVRMERLVKTCMKHPEQARHLLVRQEPYWLGNL